MRVVHIITGLDDGGAEGVLYRLCKAADHHDHAVISLTTMGKYGPLLGEAGTPVDALGLRRGRLTPRALVRLSSLVRAARPDVVQTWMYHADLVGGTLARVLGHRRVHWNVRNSDLSPEKTSWLTIKTMKTCARVSRFVPLRIACCAHAAARLHQQLGYEANKFVVIPNGVDASVYRPMPEAGARWRARHGIAPERPLIGMAARWNPQKDHSGLIDALGQVRSAGHDFNCVLAGLGVTREEPVLMEAIAAAGLEDRVFPIGRSDDVPALMNGIDLHVLSSSYGEAFPNVVAEAMACGTPCVATDVGDAAMIVGDTGWIVPRRNPRALATAISEALTEQRSTPTWSDRQHACSARIQATYSMQAMVDAYDRLWATDP